MKKITNNEYNDVKIFYKLMKFKNLKEYLECYLTVDILLLNDNSVYRYNQDISIYNFIKHSVMGELFDSICPRVKLDNDNQTISYVDINSMYPHSLRKKFQLEVINLLILKNLIYQNIQKILNTIVSFFVKYVQRVL